MLPANIECKSKYENEIGTVFDYILLSRNIVVSDAFLSFSFKLMMELIQSDDLCAEEEEVKY